VKRRKEERGLKDRIFTNPMPLRESVKEEKGEKVWETLKEIWRGRKHTLILMGISSQWGLDPHASWRGSNTV
jgi:hypothetical protein